MQYQTFLVKGFAFQIWHWIQTQTLGPANGGLTLVDPYEMLVDFEIEEDEYMIMDKRVFLETANNTNYRGLFNDNYRNMPVFFHAFYWHHVQVDYKKAKKLYK